MRCPPGAGPGGLDFGNSWRPRKAGFRSAGPTLRVAYVGGRLHSHQGAALKAKNAKGGSGLAGRTLSRRWGFAGGGGGAR